MTFTPERIAAIREMHPIRAAMEVPAALDEIELLGACLKSATDLHDATLASYETLSAELSRVTAERDEAVGWLEVVGMSAGWQYLVFETRDNIRAFISRMEGRKDG